MKINAIIEKWDDNTISIYVPKFEGFNLNGQGKTVEEAKTSLMSALEDYKSVLRLKGKEVPVSLSNIEFEYKYDISSFLKKFYFINILAFAEYLGIDSSLMNEQYITLVSEEQKQKIEEAIHKVGKELLAVQF